jgi:site-specific recombinase XerD
MTLSTGQRRHHFKNIRPRDPALTRFGDWPVPNRTFHKAYYHWLKEGGYGPTSLTTYSVVARLALGYLNKLYWTIDPEQDLEKVAQYLNKHYSSASTRRVYQVGLKKLAEYLLLRQNKVSRERPVNWGHYLEGLPEWLGEPVREFVAHKLKGCRMAERHRRTIDVLSPLTQILRWMAAQKELKTANDLTPQLWFDYLDARMQAGLRPVTINNHLFRLRAFLHFLDDVGAPVCARMLLVPPIQSGPRLPKDAPVAHLRCLLQQIDRERQAHHATKRYLGVLDNAWVHLMLYSGLRTCEIRHLRLTDIQWDERRVRIEQSKGLKDRLVFLNSATISTLRDWLSVRGKAEYLSDHVFVYHQKPLTRRYCQVRLQTYADRTGLTITPHQLRHSCATLLLNAGAPVVSVQMLLGHEKVDTTLGYARLYDGTVAADYYRAMEQVETLFKLPEGQLVPISTPARLLALVDSLNQCSLDENQRAIVQALKQGIMNLTLKENLEIEF